MFDYKGTAIFCNLRLLYPNFIILKKIQNGFILITFKIHVHDLILKKVENILLKLEKYNLH